MKRNIIRLDDDEVEKIDYCAKLMIKNKDKNNVKDKKVVRGVDRLFLDKIAIAGDLVVHKFLNKKYVFKVFKVRDDGDIKLNHGIGEIKVNLKKNDNLLKVPEWQINKDVSVYILVKRLFDVKVFEIVGWSPRSEFINKSSLVKFNGYEDKPMYCLHRSELHPAEWLILQ